MVWLLLTCIQTRELPSTSQVLTKCSLNGAVPCPPPLTPVSEAQHPACEMQPVGPFSPPCSCPSLCLARLPPSSSPLVCGISLVGPPWILRRGVNLALPPQHSQATGYGPTCLLPHLGGSLRPATTGLSFGCWCSPGTCLSSSELISWAL